MKKVIFSSHAKGRLKQNRQKGITAEDVIEWAQNIPGKVYEFKFRCIAKSGRLFEIVIDDKDNDIRNIVTIIGKDLNDKETLKEFYDFLYII